MDFIIIALIILSGYSFPAIFKKQLKYSQLRILRSLWWYHLFWGVFFYFFVFGDALGYWKSSQGLSFKDFSIDIVNEKGTYFLYALNYFPAHVLNLSYFSGTILYCFLGYMGIVFFYIVAYKIVPYNFKIFKVSLFPALFFSPNLHFWSAGVGKDTLVFFCIGLFMYSLLNVNRRFPLTAFGLLLTFFIRPHITLFLLLSFSLAYLFNKNVSSFQRIVFSLALLGIGVALLPKVMEYAKIEEASIQDLSQFAAGKAASLGGHAGSTIDISSYPLPLKVFTFLYRPLFFDVKNISGLIASFENLLLLYLTYRILKNKPFLIFKQAPFLVKGMLFFLIIGTLAFANSLGNLGIMIRMRNMFLPGLLIYILWSFSWQVSIRRNKLHRRRLLMKKLNETSEKLITPNLVSR